MPLVIQNDISVRTADLTGGAGWTPRIPSFRPGRGPSLASPKRPVTGRMAHTPPASAHRPPGAGWGRIHRPYPESHPYPSPQPPEHQQHWVHVSAPRARPGGRFRDAPVRGGRRFA